MGKPSMRELELNELKWWANWAELERIGKDAYALTSNRFDEPFFNRGGLLACKSVSSSLERVERRLSRLSSPHVIAVHEGCTRALDWLAHAGYSRTDVMTVMKSTTRPAVNESGAVEVGPSPDGERWVRAYLLSFYGDLRLERVVGDVVHRLRKLQSVELLEARVEARVAGALALFRTPRLAGVYCVGTIPEFRGKGVAGILLRRASEMATSEGRTLFLQTLQSDSAEQFYVKRGFVALYRKVLLKKNPNTTGAE